jgi:hypothetical protein
VDTFSQTRRMGCRLGRTALSILAPLDRFT